MLNKQKWGIWAEVSGGVTGHRQAWLKSNGERQTFHSLAEAEIQAKLLSDSANGNPYRTASFRYTTREI